MDDEPTTHRPDEQTKESAESLIADREALATFVLLHEGIIRSVARRKLTRATRAVFDSDDVLATVLRRMDQLAERHEIRAQSAGELVGLIVAIAENSSISKTRMIELSRSRLKEDGEFAAGLVRYFNTCETDDDASVLVLRMYGTLRNSISRRIFLLRMRGVGHGVIGKLLGLKEDASKQRWMVIRKELVERFRGEYFE